MRLYYIKFDIYYFQMYFYYELLIGLHLIHFCIYFCFKRVLTRPIGTIILPMHQIFNNPNISITPSSPLVKQPTITSRSWGMRIFYSNYLNIF